MKPGLKQWLSQLPVLQMQLFLGNLQAAGKNVSTGAVGPDGAQLGTEARQPAELLPLSVARVVELPNWEHKDVNAWTPEQLARVLTAAGN